MSKVVNPLTNKKLTVGGKAFAKLISQGFELKDDKLVPMEGYEVVKDSELGTIIRKKELKPSGDSKKASREKERSRKERESDEAIRKAEQTRVEQLRIQAQKANEKAKADKLAADRLLQRLQQIAQPSRPAIPSVPVPDPLGPTVQGPPHSPAIPIDKRLVGSASPQRRPFRTEEGIRITVQPRKLGGADENPSPPPKDNLEITASQLLRIVDGPEADQFFSDVWKSLQGLYEKKLEVYQEKQKLMERQVEDIKAKLADMERIMGMMSAQDKKDAFPMFQPMIMNNVLLKQIIETVKRSKTSMTREKLKDNFINAITHPTKGIFSLRGRARAPIRNMLATQLYSLRNGYQSFFDSFLNMVVMGPAGVGKTTVANVIAYVYNKSGILATSNVSTVTRANMIGQYVGHTAPLVSKMLFNSLEGVLFIDEAYQLTQCPEEIAAGARQDPFAAEAITEMVNFLDKYVGMSVVIAAGYEDKMIRCYLAANEGMPRRFPFKIKLTSYSSSDLTDIFLTFVSRRFGKNIFNDDMRQYVYSMINQLYTETPAFFSNQAGDILNFASFFIRRLQSAYGVVWSTEESGNRGNKKIVNAAMGDYAESKGYDIAF